MKLFRKCWKKLEGLTLEPINNRAVIIILMHTLSPTCIETPSFIIGS